MTSRQYKIIKIIATIFLAIVFGQAIVLENYLIPVILFIITVLVLLKLRGKVKDIIADERDYALGGKSAFLAIQIYSWIAVISMLILYGLRDSNSFFEPIALTLAYSTCILMLLYALIFRFYNKIKFLGK